MSLKPIMREEKKMCLFLASQVQSCCDLLLQRIGIGMQHLAAETVVTEVSGEIVVYCIINTTPDSCVRR